MEKAHLKLKWDGRALHPASRLDADLCARIGRGKPVFANVVEPRHAARNRLYWGVLRGVVIATGKWPDSESLHWALKLHTGFIEEITSVDGEVIVRPRSTAFEKMSEQDFRSYCDTVFAAICTDVVPGMTVEDLLALGRNQIAEKGEAA